ncbi:MAG: acetylornithine/succinylornithine family transaminase [Gemmatimonadetes bacterium]|nr:acetylornithine/succinylornithine family transaminase [Gemmatimonadota bacterium]
MKTLESTPQTSALLGVYRKPDTLFVGGEGSWLIAEDGRRYLDFTSGIGVNALGHAAPEVLGAIREAVEVGLIHTSNLFRTEPGERLAEELVAATFPGRVFFCNSGAETGEAAFKLARKWARGLGGERKHRIVAFHGSFHGRLFGTLAATDRPAYREPFGPLMPGVDFAEVGDSAGLEALVSEKATAAVILEPIQGEGGIRTVAAPFLSELRALCDERGVALILDEIQCGLGRSGRLFAHEYAGIRPDLLMVAKPLAGGLPMGALIAAPHVADAIAPGEHGTTFGGGPLVAHVARAVLRTLSAPAFLEGVRARAAHLEARLQALAARAHRVCELRGVGLIRGVKVEGDAGEVVTRARELGLLVVSAGPDVIRLLPALNVSTEELDRGVELLEGALN